MRRPKPSSVALIALGIAATSTSTAPALAEPTPAPRARTRLVYERGDGAEGCPTEPELREFVAARLGYDPFAPDAPSTTRVTLWRDGSKLSARIERSDATGATLGGRTLESEAKGCGELASAATFAVAVALDPSSFAKGPGEAPPAPTPVPAPAPAPPPVAKQPSPVLPPPAQAQAQAPAPRVEATPLSFFFGAGGQLAILAAPSVAPGLAAHAGLRYGAFSIAGGGRFDFPVRADAEPPALGEVESALVLGQLVPCGHVGPARFCGVISLGALRGAGYGVDAPLTDTTFFFALGPRAEVEWRPAGVVGFYGHGDLLASATRTTLQLDGVEAYRTPLLSAVLGVGIRFHVGGEGEKDAP